MAARHLTPNDIAELLAQPSRFTESFGGLKRAIQNDPADRALRANRIIGYRIMRETQRGGGWWARPIEIGETGSWKVAEEFCNEQNAETMDINRARRHFYFADPIFDEACSSCGSSSCGGGPICGLDSLVPTAARTTGVKVAA